MQSINQKTLRQLWLDMFISLCNLITSICILILVCLGIYLFIYDEDWYFNLTIELGSRENAINKSEQG